MIRQWVQFEKIVALASDAILVLDDQGVIRYANAAAERLFDRPIEALLKEVFGFVVTPDEPTEIEIARADGAIASADMRSVDMAMDGQQMSVVYLRDVSERKQAEQEALRRETFYATILEDLPELICRWLPDGTITYVNANYCRYFGRTCEDLIDKRFLPQSPEEDSERIERELADNLRRLAASSDKENAFFVTEARTFRADRELRWQRWLNRGLFDSAGRVTEIQSTGQDITEQRKTEEQLRLSAAVFDNTSQGIVITDTTPEIIAINRAFTEINGYSAEDVLGRNPNLLKSGCHEPEFYAAFWSELLAQGHWRGEIWNRRKDGEIYPQWVSINAVHSESGLTTHYVGVFSDLSDIKRSEAQIERLAHRDPLTDLPNRLLFRTQLEQALLRAGANRTRVGMLLVDIDGFRHVNDSLGHTVGDLALREVAKRLTALVRIDETVARISGDELALLIEADADIDTRAAMMAERIGESLRKPFQVNDTEILMSASIGIAGYPEDGTDVSELLQNCDAALYQAREAGGNTYRHYARSLTDHARERVTLTSELNRAIERDELVLHYQPLVETATGRITGLEALVRWQHPERGMVFPDNFIRLAEETGLIIPLGAWVLRRACNQALEWGAAELPFGRIAVNVSGIQVQRSDFTRTLASILHETGLDAARIELELTETIVMDLREDAPQLLGDLKRLGIALAMDDFGTGYSSLAYLKGLPFDTLKIDRSFISGLPDDVAGGAIVTAITTLCNDLAFEALAEGVETEAQRQFLLGVGCRRAQGYLFSRPVPPEEVERLLS